LVSFSDVSERKRVEQALRESEDRYRKLFDMESDAIFLVDVHALRFLDVNRSAETLYGYSREELLQMGPKDLAGDPAFAAETIRQGLVSGDHLIRLPDVMEVKKGGATFPGEITGRFFTFNERPVFLAAVRDMTERRRAQELLESWNSLLERRVAERTKEVEMYSNQLRGLAGQLVRAEETERRRIADILHEDLQQILVATRMTLGVALQMTKSAESKTTLAAADGMLDQSIRLTRSLVQEISVPAVREGELPYAVDWLRQQMQEKFNFTVDVTIAGPVPTVSESVYLCLYRSIQELLFNVVKHGPVDRAEVVVRKGAAPESR
jgi:PAS domain S-box-containing protein